MFTQIAAHKIKFILLFLTLFLLIAAGTTLYLQKESILSRFTTKAIPKVVSQTKLKTTNPAVLPVVYYADLEYDPRTNKAELISSGKYPAGKPTYTSSPQATSSALFVYKVVATGKDGNLLHNGWEQIQKKIALTQKNNLLLRVKTIYAPEVEVKVYNQNNQLIWQGKTE